MPFSFYVSWDNCGIGWRVEFRPCEVQITDFENAAFTVFIVLLTRTILSFGLNLYMPLSKVCHTKLYPIAKITIYSKNLKTVTTLVLDVLTLFDFM